MKIRGCDPVSELNKIKRTRGFKKWYGSPEKIDLDEQRFEIVKCMLDEFPQLKSRVKKYLDSTQKE